MQAMRTEQRQALQPERSVAEEGVLHALPAS